MTDAYTTASGGWLNEPKMARGGLTPAAFSVGVDQPIVGDFREYSLYQRLHELADAVASPQYQLPGLAKQLRSIAERLDGDGPEERLETAEKSRDGARDLTNDEVTRKALRTHEDRLEKMLQAVTTGSPTAYGYKNVLVRLAALEMDAKQVQTEHDALAGTVYKKMRDRLDRLESVLRTSIDTARKAETLATDALRNMASRPELMELEKQQYIEVGSFVSTQLEERLRSESTEQFWGAKVDELTRQVKKIRELEVHRTADCEALSLQNKRIDELTQQVNRMATNRPEWADNGERIQALERAMGDVVRTEMLAGYERRISQIESDNHRLINRSASQAARIDALERQLAEEPTEEPQF